MKVDRTKYTAHYENGVVVAQWLSIDMIIDEANGESPLAAFDRSQAIIEQWYRSKNLSFPGMPPGPPTEIPIINKAEERLGILIENACSVGDLMKYKNDCTTPYLADLFSTKLSLLHKQ